MLIRRNFLHLLEVLYLYLDLCIALYVLGLNELPVNLWDVLAENNLDISVF